MAAALTDISGIGHFDCKGESSALAQRWKKWKRAFNLYIVSKNVTDPTQQRALLLHSGGMDLQEIFFTLPDTGEAKDFEKAVQCLDNFFAAQENVPFERHQFRQLKQTDGETVDQFVVRLRHKADTCDFGDSKDDCIRDQIIEKCSSTTLRKKFLEKGKDLTLRVLLEIARAYENADMQAKSMTDTTESVNKLSLRNKNYKRPSTSQFKSKDLPSKHKDMHISCFNCGYKGHKADSSTCPAKNERCRLCKRVGHFQNRCKSKAKQNNSWKHKIRAVNDDSDHEDEPSGCTFSLSSYPENSTISVKIGGINTKVIIDSGSTSNVIGRNTWEYLKSCKISCRNEARKKVLYPYGTSTPLEVAGIFRTTLSYGDTILQDVEFVVTEGNGQSLLSCQTAEQLGVLKIIKSVNNEDPGEQMFAKYDSLFQGLGKLKDYQCTIPIDKSVQPVIQPTRRIPFQLRDRLESKLKELEQLDIIERVHEPSQWISPVIIVPKGEKDIRLCVDMRQANAAVQRIRFPIPTVDEVLQNMNNSKFFSKLDINMAYHQIGLAPESREITTFTTHLGAYRYKRLMFGISMAPEVYQMILQQHVLQGCEGVYNIMDDIIVHSETKEEHDRRLNNVLNVLQEKGLTLNRKKCQFYMSKLVYMGHELSEKGIGPTEVRVKSVLNAREPQNVSEVRSFLGLVQYSARYIPDLSTISAPLRDLLRKNATFTWGDAQQNAFNQLKSKLSRAETLGYYDKNAPTKVIVDAGPVGLGAVLVQDQNGEQRVISYASRSLSDVERKYSQIEREGLACVWALERFHPYLYGVHFELVTDCKPLEFIYSKRSKPSARLERWVLRLQPYKFTVKHISGCVNIADALSRLTAKGDSRSITSLDSVDDHEYVKFIAQESTPSAMTTREIERESAEDSEICQVRKCIQSGKWPKTELRDYLAIKNELCVIVYLVLRGTRILVPQKLRKRVLKLAHTGHPGIVAMKAYLRSKVWWLGIDKEVERFCRKCHGCQLVSQPTRPEAMTRTTLPNAPWQDLAVDVLGPLPTGDYIFVCVDYYSRYFELEITKSITAEKLAAILMKWFVTHGYPLSLRTDNAQSFVGTYFRDFLAKYGIEHRRNTPLWPSANGEIERQNRSILKRLRISQSEKRNWKEDLNDYLLMYRSTPHSTTGISPAELIFGRKIRTFIPEFDGFQREDSEIRDRDAEKKGKEKLYADAKRRATDSQIQTGDKVLLKQNKSNKLDTFFSPEIHTVVKKSGNSVVIQADSNGSEYRRNVTHVKKYESDFPQTDSSSEKNTQKSDENDMNDDEYDINDETVDNKENVNNEEITKIDNYLRPVRIRKMPEKFKDYVMK